MGPAGWLESKSLKGWGKLFLKIGDCVYHEASARAVVAHRYRDLIFLILRNASTQVDSPCEREFPCVYSQSSWRGPGLAAPSLFLL